MTYLEEGGEERWLVGGTFTMADICLAVLLARLIMVGLSHSVWEEGKLPAVAKYLEQVRQRDCYRKVAVEGVPAKEPAGGDNKE